MSSSKDVPDAWDDDWDDSQASSSKPAEEPEQPKKLTKAERRRQQAELNKKLWEEAETPDLPYFVQKSNDVPLQSGFAPQMKVLSRRPVKLVKRDPVTGLEQPSLQDEDDDEDEEAARKAAQLSAEERAEKAKREREEKQRKYDEVRQKLFGSTNAETPRPPTQSSSSSAGSRGGNAKPHYQQQHNAERGGSRGRGRGNAGSLRANPGRQLFDPNSPSRGGSASNSGTSTPLDGEMPIRQPRGPDGSGHGGRGFAARGGRGVGQ